MKGITREKKEGSKVPNLLPRNKGKPLSGALQLKSLFSYPVVEHAAYQAFAQHLFRGCSVCTNRKYLNPPLPWAIAHLSRVTDKEQFVLLTEPATCEA